MITSTNILLAANCTLIWQACESISVSFKRVFPHDLQCGCIELRCSGASTHHTGLLVMYVVAVINCCNYCSDL
jgi:hypothetical protein